MKDGLPSVISVDHDQAVAAQALLFGNLSSDVYHMTNEAFVLGRHVFDAVDFLFRNDQDMRGRSRVDVPKGEHLVVFVDFVGGQVPGQDLGEDGHAGLVAGPARALNQRC